MPGLAAHRPVGDEGRASAQRRFGRQRRPSGAARAAAGGTILRIVEFPPDSAWRSGTDCRGGFDSIGAEHAQDAHSSDPMMHKTATVDYIVVLKGEIHAIMDKGETLLKAGDVLVQRGTNHSWSVAERAVHHRRVAGRRRAARGEARPSAEAARRAAGEEDGAPAGEAREAAALGRGPAARRPRRASSSPTAAAGRRESEQEREGGSRASSPSSWAPNPLAKPATDRDSANTDESSAYSVAERSLVDDRHQEREERGGAEAAGEQLGALAEYISARCQSPGSPRRRRDHAAAAA